jgi:carboxymethylenebutenolidase
MADEKNDLSRRDFVALSLAAGLAAAAGEQVVSGAEMPVQVDNVSVKTPDGMCDAAFVHPTTGSHPAVIIWPDAFGLRPAMVDMGKRIAADGYSVLVPNPYYRMTKAPGIDMAGFNFQNQADMAKLRPLMGSIGAPGTAERDAVAFIAFLDEQKQVDKTKKFGMAAVPSRMGAGGSFHGGGLVTDQPTSPHLLIPKMKGKLYVAVAANDDQRQPDAKDKLKEAFTAANVPAEVEVYKSNHGWCVPDMPAEASSPIYNKPDAEKAWAKLVALYKTALV